MPSTGVQLDVPTSRISTLPWSEALSALVEPSEYETSTAFDPFGGADVPSETLVVGRFQIDL